MTLKNLFTCICFLLAGITAAQAKSVTLTEAGTLTTFISDEELNTLTELTVSGPINGSDIKIIRAMGGTLKTLDLGNAQIVAGGDAYFIYNSTNYYTQNDVIGDRMFYAMTALEKIVMPKDVWCIGTWNHNTPYDESTGKYIGQLDNYSCYPTNSSDFGNGSFFQCVNLKEIIFPEKLIYIGNKVFGNCVKLTSITIPEGVEMLGNSCFSECTALESVTLPATLGVNTKFVSTTSSLGFTSFTKEGSESSPGSYIFYGCNKLTNVTLPATMKNLGTNMFNGCTALKNIQLPSTLERVNSAFAGCSSLTSITFPETVTYIGSLGGCSSLTSLEIPANATIDGFYCHDCTSLANITFKGNVGTAIMNYAFRDCVALTSIIIPETVTEIGIAAFAGCSSLTDVTFPENLTAIKNDAFYECAIKSVSLARNVSSIGERAFHGCENLESFTFSPNITSIEGDTFYGCKSLKDVILPNSLAFIRTRAFYGCASLNKISIPGGVQTIENAAFQGAGLTEVELKEGVITLASNSFNGCLSLKTVTFPTTMKTINGFSYTGIKNIKFAEGAEPEAIGANAFNNCDSLEVVVLPNSIKAIGSYAFAGCDTLQSVTLPNTLTALEESTFQDCGALKTITLPETITSIGAYCFSNTGITAINLPDGITQLETGTFDGSALKSIKLPKTLTKFSVVSKHGYIDAGAFQNCYNLETVDFNGAAITTIEDYTFRDCKNLRSVTFPSTLETIGAYAFEDNSIANLTFPASLTTIKEGAFIRGKNEIVEIPATVTSIGDDAFHSSEISDKLIITPNENLSIGNDAFYCYGNESWYDNGNYYSRYYHLNNVYWNSTKEFPKDKFTEIENLYLPKGGIINKTENISHIFYDGVTQRIDIAYSENNYVYSFSVANEMKANRLNYRQQFSSTSGYSEAAGWKTIVLPYDVTEITYERSSYNENDTIALAPFGSEALNTAGTLPFWLYELGTDGEYKAATAIKAHTPYLICMPNNDKYPSEYNINGYVNFSAVDNTNGVALKPTAGALKRSIGTKFDLVPTYDGVMMHDSVYVLNEKNSYSGDDKTYPPGSVFIKNYKEGYYSNLPAVYPFQAYLVTKETNVTTASTRGPLYYSIGGGNGEITGIEDTILMPDQAVKVYARGGVLYIESNAARTIHIYNVSGRTVRTIEVQEGQNEVRGLGNGIYLLEGQKVIVK